MEIRKHTEQTGAPLHLHSLEEKLNALDGKLKLIRETILRSEKEKREVFFLPYQSKNWSAMESLWKAVNEDPDYDAVVVPVPWRYWDAEGNLGEETFCDADQFPQYVPVRRFQECNLSASSPYMIIMQNACDHCNYTAITDPAFHSTVLKSCTDHLVYIPWFVTDEIDIDNSYHAIPVFNMRYYVTVPGVVQADMTVVQSETMRKTYVEVLTRMGGEDTRAIWEKKIRGFGSPAFEKSAGTEYADIPVSKIWADIKRELVE